VNATAFMISGQGAQRTGAGAGLYEAFPRFALALDAVCAELDPHLDRPLRDVLFDPACADLLGRTEYTQPAVYALAVAQAELLASFGVRPDYVIGHSAGALVAAALAGVLSRPDFAALVATRGRLMGALPPGGAMLALAIGEDELIPRLAARRGSVDLAAVNGPRACVVAGVQDAVDALAATLDPKRHRPRRLRVSHAFHSPLVEPILDELRTCADRLTFHAPAVPLVSSVTGRHAGNELATADYWVRQARAPVRFADGIATLRAAGVTHFVELGPGSTLTALVAPGLGTDPDAPLVASCLGRGRAEHEAFDALLTAMGVVGGAQIDRANACL
jgi:acyl transferase domain-containing protein